MGTVLGIGIGIPFIRGFGYYWSNPCIDRYFAYRNYVEGEGGYIENQLVTASLFCNTLSESRVKAILYKDYVESQGGYIQDLNTTKLLFESNI